MCKSNSNNIQNINEDRWLVPYGEENPIWKATDETIEKLINIYCNWTISVDDK